MRTLKLIAGFLLLLPMLYLVWQSSIWIKQQWLFNQVHTHLTNSLALTAHQKIQIDELSSAHSQALTDYLQQRLSLSERPLDDIDLSLLTLFAKQGFAWAQFDLSIFYQKSAIRDKSEFWLRQASKQAYAQSFIPMAKLAQQQSQFKQQEYWLLKAQTANQQGAELALAHFYLDRFAAIDNWLPVFNQFASSDALARQITQAFTQHGVRELSQLSSDLSTEECQLPINLIASRFEGLLALKASLVQLIKLQPFEPALSLCVGQVFWYPARFDPNDVQQALVNMQAQQGYWLVESEFDRAYRKQNLIVVSHSHPLKVIKHEIGHWLGLEDEYAISDRLAEQRCILDDEETARQLGQNIVLVDASLSFATQAQFSAWVANTIPWADKLDWQSKASESFRFEWLKVSQYFGEGAGLYIAETCLLTPGVIALKPLKQPTFMQYFESDIPLLYLELLELH